ncbi:MAG: coenzyme F420-0:L-glutamate ligase [SAR202 cluster bacterium]|nr:coenzyme F420-0:L-glutamate ligase [SAR202 cluster bacterium]
MPAPLDIRIIGITGMPEIQAGDDLAALLVAAAQRQGAEINPGDVLVVTQKVVSKAEGRVVRLEDVEPSALAIAISEGHRRDPRHTEIVLRESKRIVRMDRGVIISETYHGFTCANAGVDASNVPGATTLCLLPQDPDASARRIRQGVQQALGVSVAVIISDTFGRPWRNGATNVAIGVAGMEPMLSYVGQEDASGKTLHTTVICVADEIAAAAELASGKVLGVPVVLVQGYPYQPSENASHLALLRDPDKDLFR